MWILKMCILEMRIVKTLRLFVVKLITEFADEKTDDSSI